MNASSSDYRLPTNNSTKDLSVCNTHWKGVEYLFSRIVKYLYIEHAFEREDVQANPDHCDF